MSLAARAEICRFIGRTSHDGRLSIPADATQVDDLLTIDITIEFTVHAWMTDDRYLGQEITTWSVGEGRSAAPRWVAINPHSLADCNVKRQQWDAFTCNSSLLEGYRVQAKYLADFRRAGAGRRPDLDLPAVSVQIALAFAFHWSRSLSPG